MKKEQFIEIADWQKATFGQATSHSKIAHLEEELKELSADLTAKSPDRRLEFADCFFLLFGAAAADGMTYDDICNAIQEKFEINKARKWGMPDENGVVNHIKEQENLTGAELIARERQEQIVKHRRTIEEDVVLNAENQLSWAAVLLLKKDLRSDLNRSWPMGWDEAIWNKMFDKPRIKRLIIAGALIAAEIDRMMAIENQ